MQVMDDLENRHQSRTQHLSRRSHSFDTTLHTRSRIARFNVASICGDRWNSGDRQPLTK